MLRCLLALWGVFGVLLLLVYAMLGLAPRVEAAFQRDFNWYHQVVLVICVLFMAYSEGYKGFQKAFAPRVAARARYLRTHNGPWWHFALAPLFCIGYFYAPKSRRIAAVLLVSGIFLLVLLVSQLDQPWRGIIDTGVVFGLLWGVVATLIFSLQAFTVKEFPYSAELPDEVPKES